VGLEPNDAGSWVALGDCDLLQKDGTGARSAYAKAIEIHEAWKDQDIAPVEREMAVLKPDVLARIHRWVRP
jgi:hypothetical protein